MDSTATTCFLSANSARSNILKADFTVAEQIIRKVNFEFPGLFESEWLFLRNPVICYFLVPL